MADPETPPTACYHDGLKMWRSGDGYHRGRDKPAIVRPCGSREWWVDGHRHRDGEKPAYINLYNTLLAWMKDGELHRDHNKPAVMHAEGRHQWWVSDVCTRSEFVTDFREHHLRYKFVLTVLRP